MFKDNSVSWMILRSLQVLSFIYYVWQDRGTPPPIVMFIGGPVFVVAFLAEPVNDAAQWVAKKWRTPKA